MSFNIFIAVIALPLVVLIHEAGHFIAAKLCKIEVVAFSLGFGKVLFSFNRGGTEYRLSLIPLGGYCKMKGEKSYQEAFEKKLDAFPYEKGSMHSAPAWKRITVAAGGPLANLLLSSVILSWIAMIPVTIETDTNRIIPVAGGMAREAGLESGDSIIAINGEKTETFYDLSQEIMFNPLKKLNVTVQRGTSVFETEITPELNKDTGTGYIGITPWKEPVINRVREDLQEKFVTGDKIVTLNGMEIETSYDFSLILKNLSHGEDVRVRLEFEREGHTFEHYFPMNSDNPAFDFAYIQVEIPGTSFLNSIPAGFKEAWNQLTLTARGLITLFRGVNLQKTVSGPIKMVYTLAQITKLADQMSFLEGLRYLLSFIAIISTTLCLMNLLPIPVLDGGQILLSFTEIIKRKPLKPAFIQKYQFVGVIIIMSLLVFVITNDLISVGSLK